MFIVDSIFLDFIGLSIIDSEFSVVVGEIGVIYEFVKGYFINVWIV